MLACATGCGVCEGVAVGVGGHTGEGLGVEPDAAINHRPLGLADRLAGYAGGTH
ncbi:MAG: hypothetical protein ICV64_00980 [Thermoleophilia bacterium]|nr:hypothetical protein [Thermoleophilia bacterium]